MANKYQTIKKEGVSDFRDRGSKFFGRSYRVESREEIDEILKDLRKEFYDARHHCVGWVLGEKSDQFFAGDDGEPSHSAGDPILGQIRKRELTNTLVVVVRYFGGTKLGVPGLINAYKTAADECLEDSGVKTIEIRFKARVNYPYESTPFMEKFMHKNQLEYIDQTFTESCSALVTGPLEKENLIMEELETMFQRSQITTFAKIED